MKGNIIEVDYAEANNLISAKTESTYPSGNKLFDKWFRGYAVATDKGTGSAGGGAPKFPGWNPSQSQGKGYEWRGKGDPSSGKGSWYNPKTKEILHPDLNHPAPYGPHWDYNYPGGGNGFRLYPNGQMIPKLFEGEIYYA